MWRYFRGVGKWQTDALSVTDFHITRKKGASIFVIPSKPLSFSVHLANIPSLFVQICMRSHLSRESYNIYMFINVHASVFMFYCKGCRVVPTTLLVRISPEAQIKSLLWELRPRFLSSWLKSTNYMIFKYLISCSIAGHIRNLAQSFDSKIPGAENLLVRQFDRYILYPRDE